MTKIYVSKKTRFRYQAGFYLFELFTRQQRSLFENTETVIQQETFYKAIAELV